jgi:hypothetical protein
MSKEEGRRRQSNLEPKDDNVIDRVVASATESSEIIRQVNEYRLAHPPMLSVPDASSEKEFIKKAKQVYREAHSPHKKRGRGSEESDAIMCLAKLPVESAKSPTQGEMVKALIKLKLSKNTAYKYAKLYGLSRRGPSRFTDKDRQWLAKNMGRESLTQEWWQDKHWQWWEEEARRSGVLGEIQNILAISDPLALSEIRSQLEIRRLQLLQ